MTSLKPGSIAGNLARLLVRQQDIEAAEAEDEVAGLEQGIPIECRFFDAGKARLFSIVCTTKGAVCEVIE